MNIHDYINSGIIEDYVLGMLNADEMKSVAAFASQHPEIKNEIDEYQFALKNYAAEFALTSQENTKQKTLGFIDNLIAENEIAINNLPLLNKYTEAVNWLPLAKSVLPQTPNETTIMQDLRDADGINQFVLYTTEDCPYEIHTNIHESLMVLQGRCVCRIENEAHELSAGDLLIIPLHKHHNLEVVDGPVIALVQRIKAA